MEGELQRRVGRNLRIIRLQMGLSQERFGQRFGFDRTYVGGLERGERNITLRTLERVSAVLDVEPVDLLLPGDTAVTLDGRSFTAEDEPPATA